MRGLGSVAGLIELQQNVNPVDFVTAAGSGKGLNRTTVECKSFIAYSTPSTRFRLNRTTVECKSIDGKTQTIKCMA